MKNTRKRSRAGLTEESDTTASSPYVDATVPEQEVDPEPVNHRLAISVFLASYVSSYLSRKHGRIVFC